ncbi:primosomal protein N' [Vagococcus jeotgali]|uniref:primosomal protein N' n=1 Tax=Vagococcus jeotgali TaxID=3109030 RepID=UPI002DDB64FA|nr:primosomal protein N' [Vagococcus sp. B2T-5]
MKRIAHVIVDVPTMQTDQPFSYLIPDHLASLVDVGIRVEVPFGNGNRHIQGFVVAIEEHQDGVDDNQLKPLIDVLDLAPVLNDELLLLAQDMAKTTYSFKITCLQTMLPSVMRSTYNKYLVVKEAIPEIIDEEVFLGLARRDWEEIKNSPYLAELHKLRQNGQIDIQYEVTTKNKIKTMSVVSSNKSPSEFIEIKQNLRKNAHQKHRLVDFFIEHTVGEFTIKELVDIHDLSRQVIREAVDLGWLIQREEEVYRDPYKHKSFKPDQALILNDEQQSALDKVSASMDERVSDVFLLEGITGSGKTEVYLQAIAKAVEKGETAIMLVPEISLTPQTVERFKRRFGDKVAVLHSGLSQGEKYDEWRKIERKEAQVVVGARSAVFAPLENIGLIIIDEEHETSYKQDESPRYHARDLAIWRGDYHKCPVLLGSATPSLESRARAQKDVYKLLKLTKRASENAILPTVEVVDMRQEMMEGTGGSFSRTLMSGIENRLEKKEQIVLLLNRRGYSSFIMCRDCGYVLPCPNCDISLTLHMDTKTMKCHYCGHEEAIPNKCPVCDSRKIRYYGTGTQKVEEELQDLLPQARILRMDVDTTRKKGSHERLLEKFGTHDADILLGTQMIAKGLDFPNVTLVGVLNADTALNLPDFRASERTFQLLTQVSGRAGRGDKQGEVVIQTFNPKNYAIVLATSQDYDKFYQHEMQLRHRGNYPPYYFTVQLVVSHEEEVVAAKKMYEIVVLLKDYLSNKAIILGPTPKSVARVNKRYYYQTVLKYRFEPRLEEALQKILQDSQVDIRKGLRVSIDTEPQHFI